MSDVRSTRGQALATVQTHADRLTSNKMVDKDLSYYPSAIHTTEIRLDPDQDLDLGTQLDLERDTDSL